MLITVVFHLQAYPEPVRVVLQDQQVYDTLPECRAEIPAYRDAQFQTIGYQDPKADVTVNCYPR